MSSEEESESELTQSDHVGISEENEAGSDNVSESEIFLFGRFKVSENGKTQRLSEVQVTSSELVIREVGVEDADSEEEIILLKDIVGCRFAQSTNNSSLDLHSSLSSVIGRETAPNEDQYVHIFAYVLQPTNRGILRSRKYYTLDFPSLEHQQMKSDNGRAEMWQSTIMNLIAGDTDTKIAAIEKRKMLVIVNPKSGPGKAHEIFKQQVANILTEAEIDYDLQITGTPNSGREFVKTCDINAYRSIICLGGDGIVFEIINGILDRVDWQKSLPAVKIGIIPCGSGNGLAKTISYAYNEPYGLNAVLGATLAAVHGKTEPMDLIRVQTRTETIFSFLSVGWGFIADIDIESESLRWIGGLRHTIWTILRIINLRTYHGIVSYLPIGQQSQDIRSTPDCPDLTSPVPENWTKITGEFILVHAAYQSHFADDCFFAPLSKLSDGTIWLCIVHGACTRWELLSAFLRLSEGTHIPEESDVLKMIAVSAFRIEPSGEYGHLVVDGEIVEYGPIQGHICQERVNVLVPDK